jgi:hypothetical protein
MKTIRQLAILAALGAATSWSMADDANKQAVPVAAAKTTEVADKSAPKDRRLEMVCTTERVTGSRFSRKICHTREEREMMKEAGKETVRKIQDQNIPLVSE